MTYHLGHWVDTIHHHHEVDGRASPVVVLMPHMTLTLLCVMQIDSGACRSDLCYDTLGRLPIWMEPHLGIKTGDIALLT